MGEPAEAKFNLPQLKGQVDRLRRDAIEAELDAQWERARRNTPASEDDWKEIVRPDVERMFSDLPDLFAPFEWLPEESTFKELAKSLDPALECLVAEGDHADFVEQRSVGPNPAYNIVNSVAAWIPDWSGEAATAFEGDVAPTIPYVVWNEFNAVLGLRGSLFAAYDMWLEARRDVCRLVESAQHAIDLQRANAGGASATAVLTLIGAIASVVAIPLSGGASAPVGASLAVHLNLVSGVSGLMAAGVDAAEKQPPDTKAELAGESPAEIIDSLRRELRLLGDRIYDQEWRIASNLIELTDQVRGAVRTRTPERPGQVSEDEHQTEYSPQKAAPFTMPRPALANTTKENATDDRHVGRPEGI